MLRPRDCVAAGLDAGGDDWAIRFERHTGMKCNAIVAGGCDLEVEGLDGTLRLEAGDCFILPRGRPFVLRATGRTGRGTEAAEGGASAEEIYAPVPHGGTAVYGMGGDFFMTGARFLVSGPAAGVLLDALPPAIVVRAGSRSEAVRWTVDRIAGELHDPRPGGALLIDQLSHVLLIEVVRQHLFARASETIGWMAALADPVIARAIEASRVEGDNLNVRAAALHVLGDLLGSVAAIAAALVIIWTGWTPILSVLVALLILRSAWAVVRESERILPGGCATGLRRPHRGRRSGDERALHGARSPFACIVHCARAAYSRHDDRS